MPKLTPPRPFHLVYCLLEKHSATKLSPEVWVEVKRLGFLGLLSVTFILFPPMKIYSWISQPELVNNLISEAIGIVVTAFIIDRLLEWRQQRRWNKVRAMVFSHANSLCDAIIDAWARWLLHLSQRGKKYELTDSDKDYLRFCGYLPIEQDKLIATLESFIGKPIGSRLQYLSRYDSMEILKVYLCAYFATHILEASDPAWDALFKDMEKPVMALGGIVDTYGVVMDPEVMEDVIGLSIVLYDLRRGESRGAPPTTIKRTWEG